MYQGAGDLGAPALSAAGMAVLLAVIVWGTVWKAIALWKAARRDQLGWYVLLLIVNTVGILEMIYIFAVAPKRAELGQEATTGPAA